jgi:agmatinase
VAAKARIVGFDLVEFMPAQDIGGMGAMTAAQLLAAAVGVIARQR